MTKEEIIKMQISRIEKEIRDTPYHKGTEHLHGMLKAKLSKLKDQLDGPANKGGGGGVGYAIKHSGDACIVLVGLPNVGKSTLLNKLTNAESKVGNYDFTTLGVVPGMLEYKGVKIQILDLPGIVEGAAGNKGFGRKVISVIRASDMVVLMTDVQRIEWLKIVEEELYRAGIRLGQRPPKILLRRADKGAIQVVDPYDSLEKTLVQEIAEEMGVENGTIIFGEKVDKVELLIDALSKSRKYVAVLRLITKADLAGKKRLTQVPESALLVSVEKEMNIEELKERLWQGLGLVRVYLKRERTEPADKKEPLIMKKGQTIDDVLKRISNQMRDDVNKACIWGKDARFPGQEVSFKLPVFDEMEVWFGR
ncbi:MAG: GTPase [Candidatus Shapirobacteria bacterium]